MHINLFVPDPDSEDYEITNYTSYSFSSDLYQLSDMAEVTVPYEEGNPMVPGSQIIATLGDFQGDESQTVFGGVVDAVSHDYNKTGHSVTLRCRDYSAFLVDEYCSKFRDYTSGTAYDIFRELIDNVSAVKYKDLVPDDMFELVDDKDLKAYSISSSNPFKIEPGDTVAVKLQELAARMGVDFYYLEDSSIFFGKLDDYRALEHANGYGTHTIWINNANENKAVKSCNYTNSIADRYSHIRLFGETQRGTSVSSTTYDNDLLWNKQYVQSFNDQSSSLANRGIEIREQQRAAGFELEYTIIGHHQEDHSWQINRDVDVRDSIIGVRGIYVVNSRTMMYGPTTGSETYIRLGLVKDYTNDPPPDPTGNTWKAQG